MHGNNLIACLSKLINKKNIASYENNQCNYFNWFLDKTNSTPPIFYYATMPNETINFI